MALSEVRLLAIVGPPLVSPDALVEASRRAVEGGVTAVQLRWKHAAASALVRLTETLLDALHVPVYVNDRADVALAAGASGVHVGQDDVAPDAVRRLAPRPFRIGVSVGSPDEAEAVRRADVDYWSVGSVYATGTKPDAGVPIGVEGFRALARLAPAGLPVIAIGGVTAATAPQLFGAGARGIAVSAALFGTADVAAAARSLRDAVDRAFAD